MKQLYFALRMGLVLVTLLLLLTACGSRRDEDKSSSSSESAEGSSSSSLSEAEPLNDLTWYHDTYVYPLSLELTPDFNAETKPPADDLIYFYLTANYFGDGKLPLPEGYRGDNGLLKLPAAAVEDFITKVSDIPASHVQTSQMYDKAKKQYTLEGFGMPGSSRAVVTNAKQVGDEITLVLDCYRTTPEADNPDKLTEKLTTTKIVYLKQQGTSYKITGARTVYQVGLLPA